MEYQQFHQNVSVLSLVEKIAKSNFKMGIITEMISLAEFKLSVRN